MTSNIHIGCKRQICGTQKLQNGCDEPILTRHYCIRDAEVPIIKETG